MSSSEHQQQQAFYSAFVPYTTQTLISPSIDASDLQQKSPAAENNDSLLCTTPRFLVEKTLRYSIVGVMTGLHPRRLDAMKQVSLTEQALKLWKQKPLSQWRDVYQYQNMTKLESDVEYKIIKAEMLLLKGCLELSLNRPLKAAYNLRQSWKRYQTLYVKYVSNADDSSSKSVHEDLQYSIRFGYGCFLYIMSMLPPTLVKLCELFGFEADREKGVSIIDEIVTNSESIRFGVSVYVLVMAYIIVPPPLTDRKQECIPPARAFLEKAMNLYPDSCCYHMLNAYLCIADGRVQDAIENTQRAITLAREIGLEEPIRCKFDLSMFHMINVDYESASKMLKEIISVEEPVNVKGTSALFLAACYYKLGQEAELDQLFSNIDKYPCKTSKMDKIAMGRIQRLKKIKSTQERNLMISIIPHELMQLFGFLSAQNEDTSKIILKDFNQSANKIAIMKTNSDTIDAKAACTVIKSTLQLNLEGQQERANQMLQKVLSYNTKIMQQQHWVALAHWMLGEQAFQRGDFSEAENQIKSMKRYKGDVMEEFLKAKIRVALKRISKAQKGE